MQLAFTVLGNNHSHFLNEILPAVRDCNCTIVELRNSRMAQASAAYLLIQGNWNQIAKLENMLDSIQKRLGIKIQSCRPEAKEKIKDCLPYALETISLDRENVLEAITTFLAEREIEVEEVSASSYQAPYIQSAVFSTKFVVLVPAQLPLLNLREEFLDLCDQLNIDAILEPVKR